MVCIPTGDLAASFLPLVYEGLDHIFYSFIKMKGQYHLEDVLFISLDLGSTKHSIYPLQTKYTCNEIQFCHTSWSSTNFIGLHRHRIFFPHCLVLFQYDPIWIKYRLILHIWLKSEKKSINWVLEQKNNLKNWIIENQAWKGLWNVV